MTSVRTVVEPYNAALGNAPTIFLQGSFVGLPLVNQALARENPTGPQSFVVTLRALLKVLAAIPVKSVLDAQARNSAPRPKPPVLPPSPAPSPQPQRATCGVERDNDHPGSNGFTAIRLFGSGMIAGELVDIFEESSAFATIQADALGFYRTTSSVLRETFQRVHVFHAQGETSGRVTNEAGISI